MVRKLAPAMALVLMALSVTALALGLGDIHTRSALNQNFDADLELMSVDPAEIDGVRVKLATAEAFDRAGVDRPFFLSGLKFTPMVNEAGNTIIRVTSSKPIREPFLNFLVEVSWPKGRLVREYTVLLDPPTTLKRRPPEITRATVAPTPRPAPASTPVSVATTPEAAPGQYGPVKDNETLWGIASKLRMDGASLTQTMMALYKANPGAFLRGDINRLKRGRILRVPSRAEVMGLSRREADAAYRAEQDALTTRDAPAETATADSQPAAATPAATAEDAELHIATARPEGEGKAGAGEDDATAETSEDLNHALMLAREETESARQESEYLRSRVESMEEEVALLRQRILNLKDEELAQVQAKLGEDAEAPAAGEPETAAEPAETEETEPAAAQAEAAQPEAQGLMAMLAGNAALIGGALAGLLALIVLVLLLRRRGKDAGQDGEPEELFEESILTETQVPPRTADADAAPAGNDTSFLSEFSPSDINTLTDETSEVDPVSEADVYIAYGRYDQAEELLNQALGREPQRMALKFKLLEVYYANHNAAAYAACAQELADAGQDGVDAEAWQRVCEMGRELNPDYPLFSAAAEATATSDEEAGIYPLSDLDVDTELEVPKDAASKQAAASGDGSELAPETGPESVLQPGGSGDEATGETEMDLTLDLDDLSMPESAARDESTLEDLESIDLELPDLDRDPGRKSAAGQGEDELSDDELNPESLQAQLDELSDLTDLEDELSQLSAEIDGLNTPLSIDEVSEQAGEVEAASEAQEVEIPAPFQEQTAESEDAQTKLDLAIAFVEMGDKEGARSILEEVRNEGSNEQKEQAEKLLTDLDS